MTQLYPRDTTPAEALAARRLARLSNRTLTPTQVLALDAAAIDRGLAKLYACLGWPLPAEEDARELYRVEDTPEGVFVRPGGALALPEAMREATQLAGWAR